jgi:hypothetical protein
MKFLFLFFCTVIYFFMVIDIFCAINSGIIESVVKQIIGGV